MILFAIGSVLLSTAPAGANARGYHHVFGHGNGRRRGIHWTTEITNPSVPVGTGVVNGEATRDHFVAPSWLQEPLPSGYASACSTNGNLWFETGWGERGDILISNGEQPTRFAYAFDSTACTWKFGGAYLSAGDTYEFKIESSDVGTGCSSGTGWCEWVGSFKGPATLDQWNLIWRIQLPAGDDLFPDIGSEVFNQYSGEHWPLSAGDGDIDVLDVDLRKGDGTWVGWTNDELNATVGRAGDPYDIAYHTWWRRFRTWLT